ncbi:alpha-fucosidase [Asticcacaulis biprosthecium C19]|uniref:Alpha-fucosidase n=1 Tax=Asticcacaulis biprosthecium C19 TaxID=715226 RepID=F4QML6_9CAUL|nr:glycoside hydrolase family 95 protein [Asticcacaulis biprosthecium]EGF91457.1 alpha-fucosidase [Asticcacaulis biprosthecium C19]
MSGLKLDRRAILAGGIGGGVTASVAQAKSRPSDLTLWYAQPAGPWVEALPVGNGRLGAMVFGRVAQERLQLNEDTLWAGSPYDPNNPGCLENLAKCRALIDAEKFKDASDLVNASMMAQPKTQMPYGAAGDLLLDFHGLAQPSDYRRSLDLDTAVATTTFKIGATTYTREVFSSAVDQVLVVRLTAKGKGRLDFDLGYRHPDQVDYGAPVYDGKVTDTLSQGAAWDKREGLSRERRPQSLAFAASSNELLVTGANIASAGIPAGLTYAVRIRAIGDGNITAAGDSLTVRGATTVTLLIAAATSFVRFDDTGGDPIARTAALNTAAAKPYAALKADHIAAHRALFRRMTIDLGNTSAACAATDIRIGKSLASDDPQLAALYVQFARYLMISSSRPGTQPANLQGIWNEGVNPPWGSKYTININTEMNYWLVEPANIGVCVEPLVRMVEDLSMTGAKTAKVMYGASGWMAHHNTDLWRASAPIDGAWWGMWPTGGAWLCKTLWDHYDYNRDPEFLKRIYPLLKGASQFFADTLVEDPKGRGLVTSPSISPENEHMKGVATCAGPAMDSQIIRDLFASTIAAQKLLANGDDGFTAKLAAMHARLPADRIGAQGQLQEWLEDWDARAPDQQHRHVSHLYGLYPSEQINVRDTPDLVAAAKVTLNTRGDLATGWGTAWRLALWARMGEAEHAHSILMGLMGPQRTYPNLFDAHPPFQIDGNFGGATGILEMLLQSWGGEILVLPALPAAWPSGRVTGLMARGGITADLAWNGGRLTKLVLTGPADTPVKLRYQGKLHDLALDARGQLTTRL